MRSGSISGLFPSHSTTMSVASAKLSDEIVIPIQINGKTRDLIEVNNTNFKGVGQPLRIALTGSKFGPGIYDIIQSLDKNEVIKRLKMIN